MTQLVTIALLWALAAFVCAGVFMLGVHIGFDRGWNDCCATFEARVKLMEKYLAARNNASQRTAETVEGSEPNPPARFPANAMGGLDENRNG